MPTFARAFLAISAALFVPTIAVVGWYAVGTVSTTNEHGWLQVRNFSFIVIFVTGAHVLLLGLPAFLIMRFLDRIQWWTATLAGFVLACLPIGIWSWPLRHAALGSSSSHSSGGKTIHTMIDGVVTKDGWLEYLYGCLFFGLLGAMGGISFWLVWWISARKSPLRGRE
jgi:hypothetical protein